MENLGGWQLDAGDRMFGRLRLQMREPDGAIDSPDTHRAVTLGDHLTGQTLHDVVFGAAIRVDGLPQQAGQHTRTAVRGADPAGDLLGGVAGPIERTV
jgi:hypothetical protein